MSKKSQHKGNKRYRYVVTKVVKGKRTTQIPQFPLNITKYGLYTDISVKS